MLMCIYGSVVSKKKCERQNSVWACVIMYLTFYSVFTVWVRWEWKAGTACSFLKYMHMGTFQDSFFLWSIILGASSLKYSYEEYLILIYEKCAYIIKTTLLGVRMCHSCSSYFIFHLFLRLLIIFLVIERFHFLAIHEKNICFKN